MVVREKLGRMLGVGRVRLGPRVCVLFVTCVIHDTDYSAVISPDPRHETH